MGVGEGGPAGLWSVVFCVLAGLVGGWGSYYCVLCVVSAAIFCLVALCLVGGYYGRGILTTP